MNVKFTDNSDKVFESLDVCTERAMNMIGIKLEKYAKALAPVDSGRLRNSITYSTNQSHSSGSNPASPSDYAELSTPEEKTVHVGTNVEYAPYQELGTRLMSATNGGKGYLRPAIQDHLSEYSNIMIKELEKG